MKAKNDHRSKFSNLISSGEIWTQLSSVGRALHRYCGGHGFESRWRPDFFRLLLSNCLIWKIYCDGHSSLSSITAVQIWIVSCILHIILFLTEGMNSINWPRYYVWLHSPVGRASHRYRGGHGFKSRSNPVLGFFFPIALRVRPWENQAEPGRRWYSSNRRFCSNLAQMLDLVSKYLWQNRRSKYFILLKLWDTLQKWPFYPNFYIFN